MLLRYEYKLTGNKRFLAEVCQNFSDLDINAKPNLGFTSIQAKGILFGDQLWCFTSIDGFENKKVAIGTLKRGKFGAELIITILIQEESCFFFEFLQNFLSSQGITHLVVESINSIASEMHVPTLHGEYQRYSDVKLYILDLTKDSLYNDISPNHHRNINKAKKNGVLLTLTQPDEKSILTHLALINLSMQRRSDRGEPTSLATDDSAIKKISQTGAAYIYQATIGEKIFSSKLVFFVNDYAYYHSGGTTEEGMKIGASHFLMYSIVDSLRKKGIKILNLDLASAAAGGLARYKSDFGSEVWKVDRVSCQFKKLPRLVINAIRRLWTY